MTLSLQVDNKESDGEDDEKGKKDEEQENRDEEEGKQGTLI